jgi:pimeloyl-ACP methyl ester carboxylesterase
MAGERLGRELMSLILGLAGVYLVICAAAYFGNRIFMYFPDPARVPPQAAGLDGVEEIEFAATDGTRLIAWYAPAKEGKPTILYFHGNAANAANRAPKIAMMLADGFGVFYLNNRGYGGSDGSPSEANNVADAIAAYDRLNALGVPAERIVAFGESLGSGQAVRLAAERPVAGVVLEAPLTSTVEVGRSVYFWLPLSLLIADQYNVERQIGAVKVPLLILHGEDDEVIPVEMGRRNYRAANDPKRIEVIPNARHNDMFGHGAWERMREFLLELEK